MSELLLDVQGLKVHFHTRNGIVKAVDGVSFNLAEGKPRPLLANQGRVSR